MKKLSRKKLITLSGLVLAGALVALIITLRQDTRLILGKQHNLEGVMKINTPQKAALNEPFEVEVEIDAMKTAVNAVGVFPRFDPDKLQILDMSTEQSFCQFYPEKKFDNNLGKLNLACGSPHPGFTGKNTLLRLTLMPIGIGTATIRAAAESQILVSDGKGTNILNDYPQATINIAASF